MQALRRIVNLHWLPLLQLHEFYTINVDALVDVFHQKVIGTPPSPATRGGLLHSWSTCSGPSHSYVVAPARGVPCRQQSRQPVKEAGDAGDNASN